MKCANIIKRDVNDYSEASTPITSQVIKKNHIISEIIYIILDQAIIKQLFPWYYYMNEHHYEADLYWKGH